MYKEMQCGSVTMETCTTKYEDGHIVFYVGGKAVFYVKKECPENFIEMYRKLAELSYRLGFSDASVLLMNKESKDV